MTLSPFLVYLVLQADDIRFWVALALLAPAILLSVIGGMFCIDGSYEKDYPKPFPRPAILAISMICGVLWVGLAPKTNTLAAMVIAPAIVNSEVVQTDIPELYKLGVESIKKSLSTEAQNVEKAK